MDLNPVNIVDLLSAKVSEYWPDLVITSPNMEENFFCALLFEQLKAKIDERLELQEEICLEYEQNSDTEDEDELIDDSSSSSQEISSQTSTSGSEMEVDHLARPNVSNDLKLPAETISSIIAWANEHSLGSTSKKFKKPKRMIQAIINSAKKGGSKQAKLLQINAYVKERFNESRINGNIIHYWNLQSWAREKARQTSFDNFKASATWIINFKKSNRIVSRKITKFVTRNEIEGETELRDKAKQFVVSINNLIHETGFNDNFVFNTDQTRIEYELTSNRSLSFKGESSTVARVQSVSSTTHSYTMQLLISKAGKLSKKFYLCLQEPNGVFGLRVTNEVEQTMNMFPSAHVEASSSGKMERKNLISFVKNVLAAELGDKNLLLQDSFTGQRDDSIFRANINEKHLIIKTIPPKTTRFIQPLDVYFFRQYKIIMRRITDYCRTVLPIQDAERKLRERKFIITINVLAHNQLSSPKFQPMLRYAWQKSGYTHEDIVDQFENALSVNFNHNDDECSINSCDNATFIICSHCSSKICFMHFAVDVIHYHPLSNA